MSFKKIVILGLLILCGCNLHIGEKPPVATEFNLKLGDRLGCMSQILPAMSGFMNGTAPPAQIEQTWACFGDALKIYRDFVQGQNLYRYEPREVANFFQTYFLEGLPISDPLLVEVMHVKQVIAGGDETVITRDEINRLIEFADQMKLISLDLLPYMKVFSFNWQTRGLALQEKDILYFEDANRALQKAVNDLAALITKNGPSYRISNIVVLFDEISKLYKEPWPFVKKIQDMLPLIYKLKSTLAGGEGSAIAPDEWYRFALLGGRGYIQYLRYYYFIKTNDELGSGTELVYLARSFDDLFSYLGDLVAAKPEGTFSRKELKEVIEALGQFLPKFKISDPLLLEAMRIKVLFFGGSLDHFTPQDFQNARAKVEIFRSFIEKLMVFAPVYGFGWQAPADDYPGGQSYFKAAEDNLVEMSKDISHIVEGAYDLSNLRRFAEEFEKLYPEIDLTFTASIKRFLPVLISTKQVLFSDNDSSVKKNQWQPFTETMAQLYARAMYFYYFIWPDGVTIYRGQGLRSFNSFTQGFLDVLDGIVVNKPRAAITFSDLQKLTEAANKAGLLPKVIPIKTLDNLLRTLFLKILIHPERRIMGDPPLGLTKEATSMIREELGWWTVNQLFYERLYSRERTTFLDGTQILAALKLEPANDAINELIQIFESPQSRSFDERKRLVIQPSPYPYSMDSADTVNLARVISRLVIRSYAMDLKRVYSYDGVSPEEADQLFTDVKPIVVALGLLDEKNTSFATSRFREANLFTPRATGNQLVDFHEFNDLVLDIFSGLRLDGFVRSVLSDPRPSVGCPVVRSSTDKDRITVACFTNVYFREVNSVFASMPQLASYMSSLPRCQALTRHSWIANPKLVKDATREELNEIGQDKGDIRKDKGDIRLVDITAYLNSCAGSFDMMVLNMMKAAGYEQQKPGLVTLGETSLVPHVMQYIETVMLRFDKNHNDILENDEAMNAYPVFKETLVKLAKKTDDYTLRAVLAWIMEKGKPPESTGDKIQFVFYRANPKSWKVRADRAKLASILGFIADAMSQKRQLRLDPLVVE